MFRARLGAALSNPVLWKIPCSQYGGWNWMVFKGTFQPKPFCESIIL